eukprot:CAMPEP_0170386224 /NCGR_PEP_ID=MMETSP0117_2-20130122/16921_1 /TAXON_ID=400756 /ORGANISM="Durinskia baltica, Strain CSIRO CS-38" /LENGTH=121 /DNA_ID=CAMNT_0010642033 /DNA_START=106 /DNA_END=471 /DNA_ORIENTATION=-
MNSPHHLLLFFGLCVGLGVVLCLSSLSGLVGLGGVSSLLSRVAAEDGEASLSGDASARQAVAHHMSNCARNEARVNLAFTAYTSPAHSIVIIIAALHWASTTLVMEQNASNFLLLFVFSAA